MTLEIINYTLEVHLNILQTSLYKQQRKNKLYNAITICTHGFVFCNQSTRPLLHTFHFDVDSFLKRQWYCSHNVQSLGSIFSLQATTNLNQLNQRDNYRRYHSAVFNKLHLIRPLFQTRYVQNTRHCTRYYESESDINLAEVSLQLLITDRSKRKLIVLIFYVNTIS